MELYLDPDAFQKEIDSFEKNNDKIAEIQYDLKDSTLVLDTEDKLVDCLNKMNELIIKFCRNGERDRKNLQLIKSTWMDVDEEIGDKITAEFIVGKSKKKYMNQSPTHISGK